MLFANLWNKVWINVALLGDDKILENSDVKFLGVKFDNKNSLNSHVTGTYFKS